MEYFLRRCWKEIDTEALCHNFDIIKEKTGAKITAVVKADGYGHGAVTVAKALEQKGADSFAVSNIEEAEELREAGIKLPILILGYTPEIYAKTLAELKVIQCVYSLDYAKELSSEAKKAGVTVEAHIKLDTGMCRLGFDDRNSDFGGLKEVREALSLSNLDISGVFTHFSSADGDEPDDQAFTKEQYERFTMAVETLEKEGYSFKTKHCCNSAATLLGICREGETVRAGIILYGLAPSDAVPLPDGMKPVMSLYSVVSMVKTVEKDSQISYGRTYTTDSPRRIATVSAGYADGVPRLLSNKGSVIINGKRAKIVGRICMDQFCVDVSDIDNVKIGDRVTVFGEGLSVDEVAKQAQTINYEIVCGLSKRVNKRIK